jgi:GDPmannose 4,6-dehydratase
LGDPTKAKEKFGWTATTSFSDLVTEMVTEDLKMVQGTIADPEEHRG